MMNNINSLHVGIFLLILLALSIFKVSDAKDELSTIKADYKETKVLVKKLIGLKANYDNKKSLKRQLLRVLKHSLLSSAEIKQKNKKNTIILSSASIDKKALNLLMGKVLNGVYQIKSFKIKKLNDVSVSFEMEIKW